MSNVEWRLRARSSLRPIQHWTFNIQHSPSPSSLRAEIFDHPSHQPHPLEKKRLNVEWRLRARSSLRPIQHWTFNIQHSSPLPLRTEIFDHPPHQPHPL